MIVFWVSDMYCFVIDESLGIPLVYYIKGFDDGCAGYMFTPVFGAEYIIDFPSLEVACGALREAMNYLYPDHLNVYLQKVTEDE